MSFNFTPHTEEEIAKLSLLEKGNYQFEVRSSVQKVSKSGNDMIEIVLRIWDKSGKEHSLYDYLLEKMPYKIKHFCDSIGFSKQYESGKLFAEEFVGKCGEVKVYIEEKSGDSPKNRVADYMFNDSPKKLIETEEDFKDDDTPF